MPSTGLTELLRRTVAELEARSVPDEALATLRQRRFGRPKLVPSGRAWRLGVLLLDRDGHLYSTATVTRAVEPLRGVTNRSAEAESRRDLRRVAARGRFAEGEAVNVDATPLDLSDEALARGSGPLQLAPDGTVLVRWNARDDTRPLADYLADRLSLLDP